MCTSLSLSLQSLLLSSASAKQSVCTIYVYRSSECGDAYEEIPQERENT